MKIPNLRWLIVGLVFLASVLNYLDRQTLSILAPTIQKDLQISDAQYASVVNLFLIAYTIAYLCSGRVTDWLGTRWSMVLFVGWWSVANMLTGLARSVTSLGACRFLLGLGEAGNYTVAPKVVAEWFPPKERGIAIGIYTLGATVGATIAPLIVTRLAGLHSWQAAFVLTGALGIVWLIPWILLYHPPHRHPRLTHVEHDLLVESDLLVEPAVLEEKLDHAPATETAPVVEKPSELALWRDVLARRDVWVLMLSRMVTDPVWYFYQFWLAKYLASARGLTQEQLAITWVVYLAADFGSLAGGFLSGRLIQRGQKPAAARLAIMLGCACILPLSPLVAHAPSVATCLGFAMLMVFAHLAWLINLSALVVDRIPQRILGTAFGVVAAGSTIGGIIMNMVVATMVSGPSTKPGGFLDEAVKSILSPVLALVQGHGYAQWFLVMAFLHPLTWLFLRLMGMHRTPEAVR